jgi:Acyl-coenzyme A:6-aminopenicillanic acid acyl-transferase
VAGSGHDDFLTVRHLRASGSNRRIGQAMAAAARAVYGADAGPHPAFDRTVQRARRGWFADNHPVLSERMAGIADVLDVEADDDGWDLGRLGPVETPAGCSAVFHPGSRTKNGHGLLGRNFDFPIGTYSDILGRRPTPGERPLAADPWVLELRPDHGYATILLGIMDMMGGMDGINEAGLAVTLLADNESPAAEPSVIPQVGLSEQQIVRYLLETCQDVEGAKQALLVAKQYYIFVPCHFLVADRSGRSFVWEYSRGHNREHIIESETEGPLVCTNHLLHRWPDPTQLPNDPASAGTAAFTYDRWRVLDAHANDSAVVDAGQIRAHLDTVRFTFPAPGVRTLWQAIYDLDDASIEVSFFIGDHNGASQYTEPLRFHLNRECQEGPRQTEPCDDRGADVTAAA